LQAAIRGNVIREQRAHFWSNAAEDVQERLAEMGNMAFVAEIARRLSERWAIETRAQCQATKQLHLVRIQNLMGDICLEERHHYTAVRQFPISHGSLVPFNQILDYGWIHPDLVLLAQARAAGDREEVSRLENHYLILFKVELGDGVQRSRLPRALHKRWVTMDGLTTNGATIQLAIDYLKNTRHGHALGLVLEKAGRAGSEPPSEADQPVFGPSPPPTIQTQDVASLPAPGENANEPMMINTCTGPPKDPVLNEGATDQDLEMAAQEQVEADLVMAQALQAEDEQEPEEPRPRTSTPEPAARNGPG
jgi:hypothetical protein